VGAVVDMPIKTQTHIKPESHLEHGFSPTHAEYESQLGSGWGVNLMGTEPQTQNENESHLKLGLPPTHKSPESHYGGGWGGDSVSIIYEKLMVDVKCLMDLQRLESKIGNILQARTGVRAGYLLEHIKRLKKMVEDELKSLLEQFSIYNVFLSNIRGMGVVNSAKLLYYIYPRMPATPTFKTTRWVKGKKLEVVEIKKYKGLRSLYHHAGLHAVDGKAPTVKQGEKCDWNPEFRGLCLGIIGRNLLFAKDRYFLLYRQFKAEEEKRHPDLPKKRIHRRALRKMVKRFLKDLWGMWMSQTELKSMEVD
jgi:hypothetical protein